MNQMRGKFAECWQNSVYSLNIRLLQTNKYPTTTKKSGQNPSKKNINGQEAWREMANFTNI